MTARAKEVDDLLLSALDLRTRAQEAFTDARCAGREPDREAIAKLVAEAKLFEHRAAVIQDRGQVSPDDLPSMHDVDPAQARRWEAHALISPVDSQLYISGIDALRTEVLDSFGITHIVTACAVHSPSEAVTATRHCHVVPILDTAEANLLRELESALSFIEEAVSAGGKVLVHCFAGQSRSAAVATAYLMRRDGSSVQTALSKIQSVRRVQPNANFVEQLQVFARCDFSVDETKAEYARWLFLHAGSQVGRPAAEASATSRSQAASQGHFSLRCKKCRHVLASEQHIIRHEPKPNARGGAPGPDSHLVDAQCAHYFVEPIRWMKTELDRGELDGRFSCPKCRSKIGSYAWQGMTCSCLRWVLPALALQRGKIDEVAERDPVTVPTILQCKRQVLQRARATGSK